MYDLRGWLIGTRSKNEAFFYLFLKIVIDNLNKSAIKLNTQHNKALAAAENSAYVR